MIKHFFHLLCIPEQQVAPDDVPGWFNSSSDLLEVVVDDCGVLGGVFPNPIVPRLADLLNLLQAC